MLLRPWSRWAEAPPPACFLVKGSTLGKVIFRRGESARRKELKIQERPGEIYDETRFWKRQRVQFKAAEAGSPAKVSTLREASRKSGSRQASWHCVYPSKRALPSHGWRARLMTVLETVFQRPMKRKKNHRVQHDHGMSTPSWHSLCLIDMLFLRGPSLVPVEFSFICVVTLAQGLIPSLRAGYIIYGTPNKVKIWKPCTKMIENSKMVPRPGGSMGCSILPYTTIGLRVQFTVRAHTC